MPAGNPKIYGQLVPLLAKYSKFAGVDDKLLASERIRAVDPSHDAQTPYARSTIGLDAQAAADGDAAARRRRPRSPRPAP